MTRRTPQGVRGLKFDETVFCNLPFCRTPQGVRGLKFFGLVWMVRELLSHPARGAWIEIACMIWM